MLRLWRDSLRVVISPERLVLVRTTRFGKRILTARTIDVRDDAGDGLLPVSVLRQALHEAAWQHTAVRVVLSNRLVRMLLTPALTAELGKLDHAAIAAHYFKDAYGDSVAAWTCQLDELGSGPAVAIDTALLQAVRECFAAPEYCLVSLQPAFTVVFNRHRRAINKADKGVHWLVVSEDHHACFALYQDGQWRQLGMVEAASETELPLELARALQREAVLAGVDSARHPIAHYAVDGKALAWPQESDLSLQPLRLATHRHATPSPELGLALAV